MAESYTVPHNLPKQGTLDLVRSPTGDNIRKQINALADASNTALETVKAAAASDATTKADAAEADAIADATTKYGGLPARVTAVETKNTDQDGRLTTLESGQAAVAWDKGTTTADLNTVQTSGRWNYTVTNALNQPVAVAGSLEVLWSSTTGTQIYTTRETVPRVYTRSYLASAWGAWTQETDKDKAFRGLIPNGSDISTWKTSAYNGWWIIETGTQGGSITGLPADAGSPALGILYHNASATGTIYFQEFRTYGTPTAAGGIYLNEVNAFNSSLWRGWRKIRTSSDVMGVALGNVNLTTVTKPGRYYPAAGSSVTEANGYPASAAGLVGSLNVENWTSSTVDVNLIFTYKPWNSNKFYIKHMYKGALEANWAEYEDGATLRAYTDQQVAATTSTFKASKHMMLKETFRRRRGVTIGTGGKAVFAFRFDHSFEQFRDKVLPLLEKYGIPASVAVNSDMYNPADIRYAENDTTTWADLKTWAQRYGLEYANHGKTHASATTLTALQTEIVDGLTQLQTNLPGLAVGEMFIQPGADYGTGFNEGNAPSSYYSTDAGRLILENHAVATGTIAGTVHQLRGEPLQGISGAWMDGGQSVMAAMKSRMDRAVAMGGGLILNGHPLTLDNGTQWSSADLEEFIQYAVAYRDQGKALILSMGGFYCADSGSSVRENVCENPTLAAGWAGTGVGSLQTEGNTTYRTFSTGASYAQNIDLPNTSPHARGSVRDYTIRARSTAGATVGLRAVWSGNSAAYDVNKTLTIPAGATFADFHTALTIPTDMTTFRLEITVPTGTVDISRVGLDAA